MTGVKGKKGDDSGLMLFKAGWLLKVFALGSMLSLGGCLGLHLFSDGGGETKTETIREEESRTTTLGKELIDLEKAYKGGVISKKEYDKARKKLIDKYVN